MLRYVQVRFPRPFGARVYVHWSALLVMSVMFVVSLRNPFLAAITICSYFSIIYLHEAGHAYFAKRLGYRPLAIYIGFLHGRCDYDAPGNPKHAAIVAWGGVVAQLVVAIPLIVLGQNTSLSEVPGLGPVVVFLGYFSAAIAIVNLAPSSALDGGKAWRLVPILWAECRKATRTPQSLRVC
ncbi:MAG: hypothetical protein ABI411_03325 [Tahibacter sp.]